MSAHVTVKDKRGNNKVYDDRLASSGKEKILVDRKTLEGPREEVLALQATVPLATIKSTRHMIDREVFMQNRNRNGRGPCGKGPGTGRCAGGCTKPS